MPYFEKAYDDELRVLLPHKWKEFHTYSGRYPFTFSGDIRSLG